MEEYLEQIDDLLRWEVLRGDSMSPNGDLGVSQLRLIATVILEWFRMTTLEIDYDVLERFGEASVHYIQERILRSPGLGDIVAWDAQTGLVALDSEACRAVGVYATENMKPARRRRGHIYQPSKVS